MLILHRIAPVFSFPLLGTCSSCYKATFLFILFFFIHTLSSRETVSADFMASCQFLKDHMDNMENPNDDMVRFPPISTKSNQNATHSFHRKLLALIIFFILKLKISQITLN